MPAALHNIALHNIVMNIFAMGGRGLLPLLAVVVAACLQGAPSLVQARALTADPALMREVEVASVGMDPLTGAPLVLLRELDSNDILPIVIGVAEAQAILLALHGQPTPRPLTHDLMQDLLRAGELTLERLLIDSLANNTFYGMLELRRGDQVLQVDTRPSDGLALALRTGARILAAPEVLAASRGRAYEGLSQDQVASALGLRVVEINPDIRESLGLPDAPGVIVTQATGQAAEAGISAGAMLLSLNDKPISSPLAFLEILREIPVASQIRIRYWQQGEIREATLDMRAPRPAPRDEGAISA